MAISAADARGGYVLCTVTEAMTVVGDQRETKFTNVASKLKGAAGASVASTTGRR